MAKNHAKRKIKKQAVAKAAGKPAKHAAVILFTSPTCHYSRLVKQFLEKNNVKYLERDVSKNHNTAKDLMSKSGQMGVPVIIIGSVVIVGYDEEAMKKALKIK